MKVLMRVLNRVVFKEINLFGNKDTLLSSKDLLFKTIYIFSSDAFSSSIALHFSVKDVSVVFISCLVSVVLDVHCIFFPWTWSFFLSILEFLLVALLLWLFYCLIGHLKGNESETRFWACLKKTACIHTILRF